jgi:hypothetical protein
MPRLFHNVPTLILMGTCFIGCSQGEPLPHGYAVFFASSSEAALVKDGVNYGASIAGPHVAELGNSGNYIYGRIEPKKGIPPHPDHAPGFFVIDSATDKVTTGLDRDTWLNELEAVGIDSPQLHPPRVHIIEEILITASGLYCRHHLSGSVRESLGLVAASQHHAMQRTRDEARRSG